MIDSIDFSNQFDSLVKRNFFQDSTLVEAIKYSLTPPGKLFRSNLFLNLLVDLKVEITELHLCFAFFLELHHTYSLVHDDLPCMDDDDFRRSKPSTHKKFDEYEAVLAGDALLLSSFDFLEKSGADRELRKFCFWCLGNKGLILGQSLDLDKSSKSFEQLLRIHELKTSRLIQVSVMGAYYFSENNSFSLFKKFWKFGLTIGLYFQLRDDWIDFHDSGDESINIFKIDFEKSSLILKKAQDELSKYELDYPHTFKQLRKLIDQK